MSEVHLESLERFELWAQTEKGWGPASILRHGKTIKTIFRKAFLTGRIQRDPTALWRLQAADPIERRRPMSDAEFERLLELAEPWFKPVLLILGATGARPSSIARLQWKDVDSANSTLYFTSRKGGTKREKRIPFPIFPELAQIFAEIDPKTSEFVFLKDGNPISGPMISMAGHRLIKDAGFKGVVLYGLRHKFATDLLRNGTSTEIARRLMGHSNEVMLKQYTSHLEIDSLEEAVTSMRKKKE